MASNHRKLTARNESVRKLNQIKQTYPLLAMVEVIDIAADALHSLSRRQQQDLIRALESRSRTPAA